MQGHYKSPTLTVPGLKGTIFNPFLSPQKLISISSWVCTPQSLITHHVATTCCILKMPFFQRVIFLYCLFWRRYHTTCQNKGDGARPTSLNSSIRTVLSLTDSLGLVHFLRQRATVNLSPDWHYCPALLCTCQSRVLWLLSSSPHLSLLWFHSRGALRRDEDLLVCEAHINSRCSRSAFASRAECVLGAVVCVSCPQLVSLLVAFVCFLSPSTGLQSNVTSAVGPQRIDKTGAAAVLCCWARRFLNNLVRRDSQVGSSRIPSVVVSSNWKQ